MAKRSLTIKAFCYENIFIICCITLAVLFQIYYINSATANVPIMDYWRLINQITEKVFKGTLSWTDFWVASGTHINPFLYLMLAINMMVFGLNTRMEIFAGIFVMLVTTLLLYTVYQRIMIKKLGYHKGVSQALYLTIIFAVFNFNQWEILTLQFSFVFMFRIFAFIGIFILLENFLRDLHKTKEKFVLLGIIIAVVICTLSQGYFPSMVGAVIFTLLLHVLLRRKADGFKYWKEYLLLLVTMGVGSFFYLNGVALSSNGGDSQGFMVAFFNGNMVKSILIMLGSSVMPAELAMKHGEITYYAMGIIMLLLYIGAMILFFVKRMWEYNYLPMTLIAYTITNIVLIYYARASLFNLEYLASSRYVCETTLGLIGVSWILIDALLGEVKKGEAKKYSKKAGYSSCILFIFIFLIISTVVETNTAPYRKLYYENAIEIMLNIESVNNKSLDIFQAGNPEYVRDGVELMKKYHLGIFHSDEQFNEYSHLLKKEIGTTFDSVEWVNGKYDDGWLEKSCEFKILTDAKGKIVLKGYYPNEITGNETGSIYVNDEETVYTISENSFTIELDAPIQSVVKVKIENNFSFVAKPPDIRKLSFILSDIQGQ